MSLTRIRTEPWFAHPESAPRSMAPESAGGLYTSVANGTRFCCGGWQFVYRGIVPGDRYHVEWNARWTDLAEPLDMLVGHVYWGDMASDRYVPGTEFIWDYVCAECVDGVARFSADLVAPDGVDTMTIRCTMRWTSTGDVTWRLPVITAGGAYEARPPVRTAVATGLENPASEPRRTLEDGLAYYAELAEKACSEHGAQLVALPEIAPQWQVPGHAYDKAVAVPGPETERFARIAREHQAVLVVGLLERAGDAVFNSAVVIDRDGTVAGVYHKVHLASSEAMSGILPGRSFPVMETGVGRVGCTICMDSSASESARMVGLNGADFLVLPIMGDHRASRYSLGPPRFDEGRWRAIQRTRAMDNQLCMVVARNRGRGSCIIDRSGEVLAYNDGAQDIVVADVPCDDGFRKWCGGCFRQVNWRQRRPHLYGAYTATEPQAARRLRLPQD